MVMIRMASLTAMLLLMSGGLIPFAAAQQTQRVSPTYSPPPPEEPPPLHGSPPQQLPSEEGIPFYTQPEPGEPAPMAPARTMTYPVSPAPSEADLQEDSGPGWQPQNLVQIQESQGVRYVSGGVGEGERAELNAMSNQFNLRLLFAMQSSGNYLADVQVNIMNRRGESVLNVPSQGPWFFAQLPPGAYSVEVSVLNQTQRQTVRIRDSRQSRLNFYWR